MALSLPISSLKSDIKTKNSGCPESEIGSQGLRKQILKKGNSWQTPFPGDEVEVHFSGRVEGGACLDSNIDKGTPFRFKLGQSEVIKGLDEGVATMKKGERAIFIIPPNLAYGELGFRPLIPPNSTLIFDVEMLSWTSIRDITGDGGILKKTTKEGEGWATPREADEVLVKYEARLENAALVSKSDEGVEFNVSDGYLCPAISKAVKTMRRGEKAELAVKFSYGIRQNENGATDTDDIPPDSNLTIKLELVSWKSVIDVTGDKKVLKRITKVGEGFDRPNEGSVVKVIYYGKLKDGTVFERKGSNEEPFEFTTLEEQINEGLDRAIMTMKKGEQALVTVTKGYLHSNDISGMENEDLFYEVELIDFIKEKPFWKMDTKEKIEACERKKNDGNVLFKAGKFWRASRKYEKAATYVEFDHSFTDDEKSIAKALWFSSNLNSAACKLKLGDYLEASTLCTKVLKNDPCNVKALYRRSQAYLKISELDKAEDDIRRALTSDPNNRDVKLVYKELKDKQREYARYQTEIFSTMLSRMG
ncbi:70 kDa peptidyl-prolyl isomerase-like isoform X2 [Castanea sativa]|uniref:70 kDa peptidyl-prolyl isomerase-like isoform X2 n=1 Tax=Castanea sativa TaxID=21020 RepID=UPI003F650989